MRITVEFDNEDEFEAFKTSGKKTRAKRADGSDAGPDTGGPVTHQAPPPLMPPQQGAPQTFQPGPAPGAQFAPPTGNAFPGAPQVDPAVQAIVTRINARIDTSIASGQPADTVLAWFRIQCGAEAANATLDQIKTVFLPKAAMPTLENIAKLMNA